MKTTIKIIIAILLMGIIINMLLNAPKKAYQDGYVQGQKLHNIKGN